MPVPRDVPVIDLMVTIPATERRGWAAAMGPLLRDADSKGGMQHAAGYMFKDLPDLDPADDPGGALLREMDRFNVERALLPLNFADPASVDAVRRYPDRLLGGYLCDPNRGVEEMRDLRRAVAELGAVAAAFFPAGCVPQVPIDDRRAYLLYATCVELGLPVFVNVGVPGPRVPMDCQHVMRLDEVMYDFPELTLVMRHGGEPWVDLAVKLMVKWPGLHYSTSAFAPKHYPTAIVDFANSSRGIDKVCYAGYFPSGLSLERIFTELDALPLKDEVWPRFLRENALRVLGLA